MAHIHPKQISVDGKPFKKIILDEVKNDRQYKIREFLFRELVEEVKSLKKEVEILKNKVESK